MNKIHGSGSITTFQVSGSDMPSNAFAVRLKIKQQHRIAGVKKEPGMVQQLQSVGANSVHQNDDACSRLPGKKPAMNCCAAGTLKLNCLNRQIGGRFSDFAIAWRDKDASLVPGKYNEDKN